MPDGIAVFHEFPDWKVEGDRRDNFRRYNVDAETRRDISYRTTELGGSVGMAGYGLSSVAGWRRNRL
jgi:hypothetical protein